MSTGAGPCPERAGERRWRWRVRADGWSPRPRPGEKEEKLGMRRVGTMLQQMLSVPRSVPLADSHRQPPSQHF